MGDSQHTQNIQINKVIGEDEKYIVFLMEKIKQAFWPNQYNYNKEKWELVAQEWG